MKRRSLFHSFAVGATALGFSRTPLAASPRLLPTAPDESWTAFWQASPNHYTDTRRFVSPALCGCAFDIAATWVRPRPIGGVSYQHPVQYTITALRAASICPAHRAWMTAPFEGDPQWGTPGYVLLSTQQNIGVRRAADGSWVWKRATRLVPPPIPREDASLSADERLYVQHRRFDLQLWSPKTPLGVDEGTGEIQACACRIAHVTNRAGDSRRQLVHPLNHHCEFHLDDDEAYSQALTDYGRVQRHGASIS